MVILDNGVALEYLILPVGFDRAVVESVGIRCGFDDGVVRRAAESVGREPRVESVLVEVVDLRLRSLEVDDRLCELVAPHQVEFVPAVLDADVGIEVDVDLRPGLAALGRHDDHAVGAARTVDGRCGGVLEDFGRGDVLRIDERDVVGDDAVHDVDRRAVIDRADTADADLGRRAGLSRRGVDRYACGPALQGLVEACGGGLLELLGGDGGHGSRHVALAHDAVSDGYDLFEFEAAGREADVEHRLSGGDRMDLGLVTYVAERQFYRVPVVGNGQLPGAVGVRGGSLCRSLDQHGYTDERLSVVGGDDSPLDLPRLGSQPGRDQQQTDQ